MRRLIDELWITSGSTLTHKYDASAYLVKGDEPTLIDCGSIKGYAALKAALRDFGYEPRDIVRVIATHGHWDHVSAMTCFREESDAKFYIHENDREAVETGNEDWTASFLYNETFPAIEVDGLLHDGEILRINGFDFTVLHTPGHTPGSVSLYCDHEETEFLIAGDTLWGGFHPRIRSDIDDWKRSLDRLLTFDFDVVTAGHMPPIFIPDAKRKLLKARETFGAFYDPWFLWDPL